MKTLVIDIETTPFLAYGFKQWQTNIYPAQVVRVPEVLCFAWTWHGSRSPIEFIAGSNHPNAGFTNDLMASQAQDLLSSADAVVTFNGDRFDLTHLNRLIRNNDLGPPSPYRSIDLRKTVKAKFLYPYASLDYVCGEAGIGTKVKHPGLPMWIGCMEGDPKSWAKMSYYNKHDVRLTDKLYDYLLPWIPSHPNVALVDNLGAGRCPRCGSVLLTKQGFKTTKTRVYQRYQCQSCGSWSSGTRSLESSELTDAAA